MWNSVCLGRPKPDLPEADHLLIFLPIISKKLSRRPCVPLAVALPILWYTSKPDWLNNKDGAERVVLSAPTNVLGGTHDKNFKTDGNGKFSEPRGFDNGFG